jgi:hypothetical protein
MLVLPVVALVAFQESRDPVASAFSLDLQYAFVDGFVQVREGASQGDRLPLHDLGMRDAEAASLQFDWRTSEESLLRWRMRWYYAVGTASFDQPIVFNGVTYAADSSITSIAELGDFTFHWQRDLFHFGDGGRFSLLAGAKFTYLNFHLRGSEDPSSGGHDEKEDFYKQALPLPSLGLRVEYPVTSSSSLYAEAFGFRAIRWNSLRSEGGTVYLSEDDFEATLGWAWRFAAHAELSAGARFDYLGIDEHSDEDGNRILMRSWGPFVALTFRF